MFGFGEDKKDLMERVKELASSGRNEDSIVVQMKREGYRESDIREALNQTLKSEVSSGFSQPRRQPGRQERQSSSSYDYNFVPPPPAEFQPGGSPTEYGGETGGEEISLEELVEEIINERWGDLNKSLKGYEETLYQTKSRLDSLEGKMNKLENKEEKEKERLGKKLEETKSNIQGIESRISGIERAFKEFLPQLTDNVKDLSEIVNKMKSKK